jgi:hypothetical protein
MIANPEGETQELTSSDELLKGLVQTIIADFDGDTTAFFDSVKNQTRAQSSEQEEKSTIQPLR